MRGLVSSLFIALILLNTGGYYFLFMGMEYKNTQKIHRMLDFDQYDESETVLIKIPLTIPYATDSRDFVRSNGKFEHEGEVYRIVKQKFLQDTLQVVCIKDQVSTHLNHAKTDFIKTFSDRPEENKSSAYNLLQKLFKDYCKSSLHLQDIAKGWCHQIVLGTKTSIYMLQIVKITTHPPEL